MNLFCRVLLTLILLLLSCPAAFAQDDGYRKMVEGSYVEHGQVMKAMQEKVAKVHELYAADTVFLAAFDKAQQAWQQYHDAQIEALYPGDPGNWGSIHGYCVSEQSLGLIYARIEEIDAWITGLPEGETCGGSIRTVSDAEWQQSELAQQLKTLEQEQQEQQERGFSPQAQEEQQLENEFLERARRELD